MRLHIFALTLLVGCSASSHGLRYGGTPTPGPVVGLPSQGGNSGKFLTTNGSSASWGTVSSGDPSWNMVTLTKGCMDAKAAGVGDSGTGMVCDTVSTGTAGGGGTAITRGVWVSPGQDMHVTGIQYYHPFVTTRTIKLTLWNKASGTSMATCNVSVAGQGIYSCTFTSQQVYGGKSYYVTSYDISNNDNIYVWASSGGPMTYTGAINTPPQTMGPFIMFHPSAFCTTSNADCVPNSQESSRFATTWPTYTIP